jgi:CUB/sushi domain-containing protein
MELMRDAGSKVIHSLIAVDCGPLAVPQNGSRHGSLTEFPNMMRFSCDEGFLLRGSSYRVCQANRTWDGTLTRCEG